MKISEITIANVADYLRLETGDYTAATLNAIMESAKQYIVDYTGIAAISEDATVDTLDNHPDFYIAYMVLCQDMYDSRAMYIYNSSNKSNVNKVVETILNLHCVNLL